MYGGGGKSYEENEKGTTPAVYREMLCLRKTGFS